MSDLSAWQSNPIEASKRSLSFPKSARILRTADFRRVYDEGFRVSSPYFTAFCAAAKEPRGPRIGLSVSRATGKAVIRNRVKRRLREAVRRELWRLEPRWEIVINARQAALTAPLAELRRAMERLFSRCQS
ncbi:MAG: ribonuclease P protein component [Acidobacteriota bacterium]